MVIVDSMAGRRLYQVCACDRLCMEAQGEAWHGCDETTRRGARKGMCIRVCIDVRPVHCTTT